LLRPNPSDQWERLGRDDPYYGVYSVEEFRGRGLDRNARERFFKSGREYIDGLLADMQDLIDPSFTPDRALEYGCGVGRLLIPLAQRTRELVGVDVSPSMLAEAARNCEKYGVSGVRLIGTKAMARLESDFDLVHSALVLQHIPMRRGERILSQLVRLLRPGGVAAVHVPIAAKPHLSVFNAVMKLPLAHNLLNVARGRPWSHPQMQMNVYKLNRLLRVVEGHGVELVHVKLGDASGGYEACTLIFQR
jgi:2-polyprenyl-3-methyl-5-hydroxy-6-metoxy-1,4-benzoquinol methylase